MPFQTVLCLKVEHLWVDTGEDPELDFWLDHNPELDYRGATSVFFMLKVS